MEEEIIDLLKEQATPIASCILSGVISYIVSVLVAKKWIPVYREKYEELRIAVSEALNLYASLYNNPVDIARVPEQQLPPDYREASLKLRELASKMQAFSEVIPAEKRKIPTKRELREASSCLLGLAHSLTTPYNSVVSDSVLKPTREYERRLRQLLHLPDARK